MDDQNVYEVTFVGQDYQPINDAVNSVKIMHEGREFVINSDGQILLKDEQNKISDSSICWSILERFLGEVAPNGKCSKDLLIINPTKENNKKLYDLGFGSGENLGYFCGIVGVIRKSIHIVWNQGEVENQFNVTLQIKSRLDVEENGKIGKPFFLSTMLLRDKVSLSNNTIPSNEDEIFDYLLLFWFKEQLQQACLKGYYKTYRRFENNDDKVKGTLDIARHIKLNSGQKNGCIAYSYRENTINNYLNHLIVAAYYHLKNKYYDLVVDNFDRNNDLKKVIDYLSSEIGFSNANVYYLINKNVQTIAHPYFTEYEHLRLICLKILRDEGISIFDGESDLDTQGILFYLPELWEKFLEDEIIRKALPKEIVCKSQYRVDNFGYLKNEKYEYKQTTYPDYVFFNENKPFMILDAKCKPKWESIFDESSVSEVMGDYNKCLRDMVAINAHATGVIFPTNREITINDENKNQIVRHSISDYNNIDSFYTIPIQVPPVKENDKYSNWSNEFEKKLYKGIEIVKDVVDTENKFAVKNRNSFEQLNEIAKNNRG